MKAWIAAHYPGTKLAITEYNWGRTTGISAASRRPRRSRSSDARAWTSRRAGSRPTDNRVEDAFRLYLDYDGAGAQVAGDSVRATSANVDAVGAYAVRGGADGNTLYILLFNKDTAAQTAAVSVPCGLTQAAQLFRFSRRGPPRGGRHGDAGRRLAHARSPGPLGDARRRRAPHDRPDGK